MKVFYALLLQVAGVKVDEQKYVSTTVLETISAPKSSLGIKLIFQLFLITPFFHALHFYLRFAQQMALLGFLPPFLSFYLPPCQVFTMEQVTTGIVRERAHVVGFPRE